MALDYGLLTDVRGCPVAVSVHGGNVADSTTFLPAVQWLRERFGIGELVLVDDRGMIGHKAIAELRSQEGIGWITALESVSIRTLIEQGDLQPGLFDERNLPEFTSPGYPGERLVACRNPQLATLRAIRREDLLLATERTACTRLANASTPGGCARWMRSGCAWAGSSTSTRSPGTSS